MKNRFYVIIIGFIMTFISFNNSNSLKAENILLAEDSIKLLVHENYVLDGNKEVREIILDYKKNSKYKKNYYKADSLFLKHLWGQDVFKPDKPDKKDFVVNPYLDLLKTYVSISKFNGSYIFFSENVDDIMFTLVYVKDKTITFLDTDGWFVNYYKKIGYSKDRILIDLYYNPFYSNTIKIEIKRIDSVNDIQIWKTTRINKEGKTSVIYELKAPLNYALKLPILVINNTAGLDVTYEGLDKIDLKKLFYK